MAGRHLRGLQKMQKDRGNARRQREDQSDLRESRSQSAWGCCMPLVERGPKKMDGFLEKDKTTTEEKPPAFPRAVPLSPGVLFKRSAEPSNSA